MLERLYEQIVAVLDNVGWHGPEIRMTGNSLGAQVALNLAAMIRTRPACAQYSPKLQRVALFDPFFSAQSQYSTVNGDLPERDTNCPYKEDDGVGGGHMTPSEHARCVLIPQIRTGSLTPPGVLSPRLQTYYRDNPDKSWSVPVIELYMTSVVPWGGVPGVYYGDVNQHLLDMTVYIRYYPNYYGGMQIGVKHVVGIQMYMRSRFAPGGPIYIDPGGLAAPSALMDTDALKKLCNINIVDARGERQGWFRKCARKYTQIAGKDTIWESDDEYQACDVTARRRLVIGSYSTADCPCCKLNVDPPPAHVFERLKLPWLSECKSRKRLYFGFGT